MSENKPEQEVLSSAEGDKLALKLGATRNLIVVSDIHATCRMAVCPEEIALTDGGTYRPSPFQEKINAMWWSFWHEWVPKVTRGELWDLCINGELVDGRHHNTTTQFTQNPDNQREASKTIIRPVVNLCPGRFFATSGTPVHSGESGCDDESVARELGAVPDDTGRHARYELWIRVGSALCHVMHHIGTTGRTHYESSAPMGELGEALTEAGRWEDEPPQFIIRSHRHRYVEVRIPTSKGFAAVAVTPGWQAKTPFAYRTAGARQSPPQFGGLLIRQGDEEAYTRPKVWTIGRPRVE